MKARNNLERSLMFERKAGAYPSGAPKKAPPRVSSWPYQQTLLLVGKACQGQALQLITNIK